jgi:hypothetical protein
MLAVVGRLVMVGMLVLPIFDGKQPQYAQSGALSPSDETPGSAPPDWETYVDPVYGISLRYPPQWQLGRSVSMGYPYTTWLDPIAQEQPPSATEIVRGALAELYIEEYSSQASLKEYLGSMDPTFGGLSDPGAEMHVVENQLGSIRGITRSIVSEIAREDMFAFVSNRHGKLLLFRFQLYVPNPAKPEPNRVKLAL